MGDREVDEGGPDAGEDHPGAELGPVGDGAGDQGDGDDREHGLEGDEGHGRVGAGLVVERDLGGVLHQALETQVLNGIAEQAGADVVAEGHGVAVENPEDGDRGQAPKLIIIMLRTLFARTMPP